MVRNRFQLSSGEAGQTQTPARATAQRESAVEWLADVETAIPPTAGNTVLWVKSGRIRHGLSTIPQPHRHSFCELSLQFKGQGTLYAGCETMVRKAGDLLLMAPQVPHWYEITRHPVEYVTIYFFPTALVNWVSPGESTQLLHRFTAVQPLERRNVRLPQPMQRVFAGLFRAARHEYATQSFGWELHLQSFLTQLLVSLARWERKRGSAPSTGQEPVDWLRLDCVLQYMRRHLADPVYGRDLAKLAAMSESSFHVMFRHALGMSWLKYLQGLRIQKALTLMAQPGETIASVAFACGFESLSHFNSTFRSFMGMSPKRFRAKQNENS